MMMTIISALLSAIIALFSLSLPQSGFPSYLTQAGTPVFTQNFISPESGCAWGGVAGQVFGLDGLPSNGRIIEVRGELGGQEVIFATTTGSSLQMGPGGYDIQLDDSPVSSQGDLHIQIVDPVGVPLSRRIYFETVGECDQNLTIVNMIEFEVADEIYLPIISHDQ